MSSSILTYDAEDLGDVWRDYWGEKWHHPLPWPAHRLSCFITAENARKDVNRHGDPLVSDFPRGRRPFLGVLSNGNDGGKSTQSGVLEYNDDGHLLTIAPTRAGKGAAQIVPNLLLYAGSCLVIDIKGENYGITQRHRSTFFDGAKVIKFAPFADDTHCYNPLDFIRVGLGGRPTADTFDDARLLAEMMIPVSGKDPFWEMEARGVLTMLLLYVATRYVPGDLERCMSRVIELLFPPSEAGSETDAFTKVIGVIQANAEHNGDDVLAAHVTQFREHEDKVRRGILSSCRSAMSIWLSPRLAHATCRSDFQFSDLKRSMCRPEDDNPAPTTIYVVIPPEYLKEYRPVLRMMVGLAAVELTRPSAWNTPEHTATGWAPKPPCQVLFLLDEFPALGHMGPIEQGIAYLAGYGVQLWTFAQSLGQLKEIYKENWTTFVSNAGASSYFGMADPEVCEFLSAQLGKTGEYALRYFTSSQTEGSSSSTTTTRSSGSSSNLGEHFSTGSNTGSSDSQSDSENVSRTITEQVRYKEDPVAPASDIRAMPRSSQIVLLRHTLPAIATLMPYYEWPLFAGLYDEWRP